MNKLHSKLKVLVAVLAMSVVPTFSGADLGAIVGNNCLVPIYHTNFPFPPEGGQIIKVGNSMYFVQNYRAECANAGSGGQVIKTASSTSTVSVVNPTPTNTGTNLSSIVGDNCLVPIYHTDFMFPPEGGQIVKIGDSMYFHQNYRPECANSVTNASVIRTTGGAVSSVPVGGVAAGNNTVSCASPR